MKLDRTLAVITFVAVALVVVPTGCGGSSGPESSVNGCEIKAGTSCQGADLSAADLSGADLSGADLSTANLEGASLSRANLTRANLSGAQIVDTNLSDADLTRANLTGATITGANFEGATLCGTTGTDGTIDDSSCPPPSTDTTDTTFTRDTTSAAEVTTFVVGDLTCPEDSSDGSIAVSWTTQNATAVEIGVDGEKGSETGPSGSEVVSVPCDGQPHDVSVTALGDAGAGKSASEEVSSG